MGCTSSSSGVSKGQRAVVDITGVDLNRECKRPIKEFPEYSARLTEIDYNTIIQRRNDWKDPYFKPNVNSLIDENMMRSNRITQWQTLTWKRPQDVYGEGNFALFVEPGPNDIKQGKCGDCYYLSTLSSLAEYPERIKKIFLTDEVNEAGCYAATIYINGEARTVVVDDYFPYDPNTEKWAFSSPSKDDGGLNEIWVLVLEKMWAKVFGSYQRIEAGTAGEAMYPLTGCPHQFFIHANLRNRDHLWQKILYSDQQQLPMCTAVASQTDQNLGKAVKSVGLVDAHAYSLIAAKMITLDDGKTERLIQIRNPWGKKEWQGDWSDKSLKWTENTKQQVGFVDKDDGCFWIAFADYLKFFYITTICYYNDKMVDNWIADQHDLQSFGMAKFKLDEDLNEQVILAVDQVNARFVDETMRGSYEYPAIKLMLTKVRELVDPQTNEVVSRQQIYLSGNREGDTHVSLPLNQGLKKGEYLLMYQADFKEENPQRKLVISVYCGRELRLERVSTENYPQENFDKLDWALYEQMQAPEENTEQII